MATVYLQRYNMYFALAIHLTGFLAAVVTGRYLHGYRLFPIIKWLLGTLTCAAVMSYGVSIIGSVLMLSFGQSLTTCTLFVYNMSVAILMTHSLEMCLAVNRFYISEKKVPNVRKMLWWNTLTIIATFLVGHVPILLSVLGKPIPFVAQCAGFEDDQPDNWYGLVVASILFISWVVTACFTFKLKRILNKSAKSRYSHQIPDNMMKIGNALMSRHLDFIHSVHVNYIHSAHIYSQCVAFGDFCIAFQWDYGYKKLQVDLLF